VFERFTDRARQVVVLAQEEARALNHNYIGTEHFLLGLLREQEGLAAGVLGSLGITLEGVRTRVVRIVGQGDEPVTGQIPFTKHAVNVTNLAQREALSLGHNYIGTEHILLALVRENEGLAARILLDFPADAEKLREEIIRTIGFERFTERGRQVVVLAQNEARVLRHNYIGTEHILLGLLREQEGLAARVLESLGVTLEEARARVVRIVGQGDEVTTGQIPFTPRAKKVLELALREALSLGNDFIGTEHLLLGLLREHESRAVEILGDFDAGGERIRERSSE
jgi:ATP-dependent Clp protease ATP-binding subunit ClpA